MHAGGPMGGRKADPVRSRGNAVAAPAPARNGVRFLRVPEPGTWAG